MTNPNKATSAFTEALANHLPTPKKAPVEKLSQAEQKQAFVAKFITPITDALRDIAPSSFEIPGFVSHDMQGNAVFAVKFVTSNPKSRDNFNAEHPYFSLYFSDSESRKLDLRVSYDGKDGHGGAKLLTENGDLDSIAADIQIRLAQWVARVSPASVAQLHQKLTAKKPVSRLPRT